MHVLLNLPCAKPTPTGTQSFSLAATVPLWPTCMRMHLSSCSHVHGNAYSVLRPMQSAGPAPPRHQHICAFYFIIEQFAEFIVMNGLLSHKNQLLTIQLQMALLNELYKHQVCDEKLISSISSSSSKVLL